MALIQRDRSLTEEERLETEREQEERNRVDKEFVEELRGKLVQDH